MELRLGGIMREILFKAKRIDNGEWVEGYYLKTYNSRGELTDRIFREFRKDGNKWGFSEIDPETLCQYTGLNDKNGKKVWENDILKGFTYPFLCDGEFNYFVTVEWSEEYKYFLLYTVKNPKSTVRGVSEGNSELFEAFSSDDWEVIGNVFDNPELLGRDGEDH